MTTYPTTRINWQTADTADETARTYDLVPPGTYMGEITDDPPELDETEGRTPAIVIKIRLQGEGVDGRLLWQRFYLSDKALPILKNFLWTANFSAEYLAQDDQPLDDLLRDMASVLPYQPVTVTVQHETWPPTGPDAKKRAKIKRILAHAQEGYPPKVALPSSPGEQQIAAQIAAGRDLPF